MGLERLGLGEEEVGGIMPTEYEKRQGGWILIKVFKNGEKSQRN